MKVSPPHPLFSAQLRAARARRLIGTLKQQLQRWTDESAKVPYTLTHVGPTEFSATREDPPVEYLFRAAVTVGEVAYNCRAALDYLVRELATGSNNGREVRGTQFPIEDEEAMFWARVNGIHPDDASRRVAQYLKKVPPEAVDIFRGLQPFAGCEWTALLRDISNPDKHRFVSRISSDEDFRDTIYDPKAGKVTGTLVVRVVFEHDRSLNVVSALSWIQAETAHLIATFAPVFVEKT